MPLRRAFGVLVVVLAMAALTAAQSQGPLDPDQVPVMPSAPQPQFRSGTLLVPIDVRVIDKNGQPVTDLTESDFAILEDRTPQKIAHFEVQRYEPDAAPAVSVSHPQRAANAFDTTSPNRRTFLLLLGRGALQEPSKGVDAMMHLLRERAMPQDYVAVMAWNRATDFTTDRELTAGVIERFRKDHLGIELALRRWSTGLERLYGDGRFPQGIQNRIDAVFGGPRAPGVRTMDQNPGSINGPDQALRRMGQGLLGPQSGMDLIDEFRAGQFGESLDQLLEQGTENIADFGSLLLSIEYMRQIAGQKQVLFLSEYGFTMWDTDLVRLVGRRASDARVAMNFIHAGGMPPAGIFTAESRTPNFTMGNPLMIHTGQDARTVTSLSGGQFFAHQFKNSSMDVDRIDQASRFHYTLGYYPTNDPTDGKYRRIQVKVTRPGVTVLARDGYYARANVGPVEMRSALVFARVSAAAARLFTIPDIQISGLIATSTGAGARDLPVSLTIDLSRVYFEKKDGLNVATIDVAVFAVGARQRAVGQVWQNLNLSYTDARLAELLRTGLHHETVVPLTAAAQDVKAVVYDYSSDLVGSGVGRVKN